MAIQLDSINEADKKYAIKEDGGLMPGDEATKELWCKVIARFESLSRFWAPRIEVGQKCQNYMRRDIYTPEQRKKYSVQDKITVEPQEMKPVINRMVGMVGKSVRSGAITFEDSSPPENVAKPDVINVVIKWWENGLKLLRKKKKILREGLITGYPGWLTFDRKRSKDGWDSQLGCTVDPWNSTLCSPFFLEEDGLDIDERIRTFDKTTWEMLDTYPNRKKAWEAHYKAMGEPKDFYNSFMDGVLTADDRSRIFYDRVATARYDAIEAGRLFIVERTFTLHTKQKIWTHRETMDSIYLPPEWKDWQREQWKSENPEYTESWEDDVKTLWVTVIDNTGFVWDNSEHWFQREGRLNAACFIPSLDNNVPVGAGEDMLPYILSIAVSETEGLAQVRTGTGTTTHVKEGALRHPAQLGKELALENGVVIYKKDANLESDMKTVNRTPNITYQNMADRSRQQLSSLDNQTPSVMGQSVARESERSRQARLSQSMMTQDPYVENYTNFNLNVTQLLCDMMPYALNEYQLIQIEDEYGKKIPAEGPLEVNKPEFDQATGEASKLINDLTAARYRVIPIPSDDSPTNREQELKDFVEMIQAVGNTLLQIDPRIVANIWKSWPNKFAREAAAGLEEFAGQRAQEAQAAQQSQVQGDMQEKMAAHAIDMEKIKRPRWNIRLQPSDYQEAPEGFRMMMQTLGAINATAPDMGQQPPVPVPEQQAAAPVMA